MDVTTDIKQSKVVENENIITDEQSVSSSEQAHVAVEDECTESTEVKQKEEENQVEQDPQMDVEVKGNTPTVKMSWEKNSKEGADVLIEERIDLSVEDKLEKNDEQTEVTSSANASNATDEAPSQTSESNEEVKECTDKEETQMDVVVEKDVSEVALSAPTAAVTCGNDSEGVKSEDGEKKRKKRKKKAVKETTANGKHDGDLTIEPSPSKKAKPQHDEFCIFVGNLNNSKTFAEVKESLENFLTNEKIPFKDIRFTRSKKHAYISLPSATDLATALKLDGKVVLDKPLTVTKPTMKQDKEKVLAPAQTRKERNSRCLLVENIPVTTTKKRIKKLFPNAVEVRIPGGKQLPIHGKAYVEFPDKAFVAKAIQRKQVMIKDQVLTVNLVGEAKSEREQQVKVIKKSPPRPNHTLHVGDMLNNVKESHLRQAFPKASHIDLLQTKCKRRRFAFVQFENVKQAKLALKASQNLMICGQAVKIQYSERPWSQDYKVLPKTLVVMGLAAETTAETLQSAFEGATTARVTVDHITGISKKFGFVDFESEEACKAAKESMEDSLIDGSRVTVAIAHKKAQDKVKGGSKPLPAGQSNGQKTGKKESNKKGNKGVGEKRKADTEPKTASPKKLKVLNDVSGNINSAPKTFPPKKSTAANDGFCLFIGNLNISKSDEEIKNSLANYLTNQSLLFEDIRLDRSKKHAFVDLASENDLNKAVMLNGASILDKPVKISKANVKSVKKVKAPPVDKEAGSGAGKKKRGKKGKKGGSGQVDHSTQDPVKEVKSNI